MYRNTGSIVEDHNLQFIIKEETPIQEKFSKAIVEKSLTHVCNEFKLEFEIQLFEKEAVYQIVNGRNVISSRTTKRHDFVSNSDWQEL